MPAVRFREILRLLCRGEVDFIVVGGINAVLQGVPLSTFDLNIVHSRSDANVEKLLAALDDLEAVYRVQPERRLKPSASHLRSAGHQLLITEYGPLDVLGRIGANRVFEGLLERSNLWKAEPGMAIRILDLETQIKVKVEVGAAKDLGVLPPLRRTLSERSVNRELDAHLGPEEIQ